jgi:glycosyltransferase involved in cell wall biosynthesis
MSHVTAASPQLTNSRRGTSDPHRPLRRRCDSNFAPPTLATVSRETFFARRTVRVVVFIEFCTSAKCEQDRIMKLSVYIVTLNEEERLENTLKAASQVADDMLVVDSGSTDRTEEIARKYGARFVFHKWKDISSQKRFAQNECHHDWVLSLDADEVLSDPLIEEINDLKRSEENPIVNVYKVKITAVYPGEKKPGIFANHYNLIRLYNRKKATMPDNLILDRVVLDEDCRVKQLKNEVYHFSYISLTKMWYKYNLYSDEQVKAAIATGKRYSKWRLPVELPAQFLRYYILRGQFLHGWWGLISATTSAYFRFLKVAKYVEYQMTRGKGKS